MADDPSIYLDAFVNLNKTCVSSNFYIAYNLDETGCAEICYNSLRCQGYGYSVNRECILQDLINEDCHDQRQYTVVSKLSNECSVKSIPRTTCSEQLLELEFDGFGGFGTGGACRNQTQPTYDNAYAEVTTVSECRDECVRYVEQDTGRKCLGIEFNPVELTEAKCEMQLGPVDGIDSSFPSITCEMYGRVEDAGTCQELAKGNMQCGNMFVYDEYKGTCKCVSNGLDGSVKGTCDQIPSGDDTFLAIRECTSIELPVDPVDPEGGNGGGGGDGGGNVGDNDPETPTTGVGNNGIGENQLEFSVGIASGVVIVLLATVFVVWRRNKRELLRRQRDSRTAVPSPMSSGIHLSSVSETSSSVSTSFVETKTPKAVKNIHKKNLRESKWPNQTGTSTALGRRATQNSQFFSYGTSFLHRMGISLRDLGVRISSIPTCQCKKKRPVAYDDLTKDQLIHVCGLKRLKRTGPRDALVLRLLLDQEKRGIPTCRQCLFSIPQQ